MPHFEYSQLLDLLVDIAPEIDAPDLDPDLPIREQVDLDSMDFLRLMQAIFQKYGVNIPESDYPKVACLADLSSYVGKRITAKSN